MENFFMFGKNNYKKYCHFKTAETVYLMKMIVDTEITKKSIRE